MKRIYVNNRLTWIIFVLLCINQLSSAVSLHKTDTNSLTAAKCNHGEFQCDNGDCIDFSHICDGARDCTDASDERKESCTGILCPDYLYTCAYGACVGKSARCNGIEECADGSDEYGCNDTSTSNVQTMCKSGEDNCSAVTNATTKNTIGEKRQEQCEYKCGSGECLGLEFLCDGESDCSDGSDETRAQCGDFRCPSYLFACKYGACILKNKVCDGQKNCADGSDEMGCNVISTLTVKNETTRQRRQAECEFKCNSGECLGLEFLCDGNRDCNDGSDETKTRCGNIRCQSFLFQCKYGACIPKAKVCDGEKNCADNSDEEPPACDKPTSSGNCNNFEFRCRNGQCIDNLNTCDGVKDCTDGSDETEDSCRGLVCPDYLFRCAYGACISRSAKCNGVNECADGSDETGCPNGTPTPPTKPTPTPTRPTPTPPVQPTSGCVLPRHLANGKYIFASGDPYVENTVVGLSANIKIECHKGYLASKIQNFFCVNQNWIPNLADGSCRAVCPPLPSTDTYNAVCDFGRTTGPCEDADEGVVARITCKPYFVDRSDRVNPLCTSGAWDPYPIPCEAECGQKTVNAQELVVNGSNALPGEYPWIVGIYNVSKSDRPHICGGSLISRFYIVTAAHCLADNAGNVYPDAYFNIAAGKYYRSLDKSETDVQIRTIKRKFIHEDYKGLWTKYRDDIALIEVDRLELTPKVQTICLDWKNKFEDKDFQENNLAVVAGWGFTRVGSTPAEVLKKLIVPYRPTDVCRQFMDPDFFQQYYSSDKICAGYKDEGKSVCSGDSGGGLYFRSEPTVFYIRGLVSLSPRTDAGCNTNHYALYTKLSKYLAWIEQITRKKV